MFCPKCGNQIPPAQAFCNKCGASTNVAATSTSSLKTNGGINKNYIFAAIGVVIILVFAVKMIGFGDGASDKPMGAIKKGNPKNEITQTIESFSKELNTCYDVSVYFDGGSIDVSPLEKYAADSYALEPFYAIGAVAENAFSFLEYLPIGSQVGSDVVGALLDSIPIVGGSISEYTEKEIKNDPLLNKDLWKKAVNFKITPANINIGEDEHTATLTLNLNLKLGVNEFKKSNIAKLIGVDMEPLDESMGLHAAMAKNDAGNWLFTEIIGAE